MFNKPLYSYPVKKLDNSFYIILFYFNNSIVGGRRFEPWLEILKSTNWLNYRTLGWTIHSWLRSFCTSQARSQFIFYMLMGIVFC